MSRNRFLILYDIRDDKRLRAVFNVMRSHGSRFQYSVFLCDLSPSELLALRWELKDTMNEGVDSVAIVDLGPTRGPNSKSVFEFLGIPPSLPSTGSRVL